MATNTTYSFGSGTLFAEIDGDVIEFGVLQSATVSFESDNATLMGNKQFPLAVARTGTTISGTASYATINSEAYNRLFFGDDSVTGSKYFADEDHTIDDTAYVVSDATNFIKNFGVKVVSGSNAGAKLTKVATTATPQAGQYKVDETTGTYTFATADEGLQVEISYSASSTAGKTTYLTNKLMGNQPEFSIILASEYQGKTFVIELYKCISTSWSIDKSNTDFTIPSFEFQAFANDADRVGEIFSNSVN